MQNSEQPSPILHTDTTDPLHDSPGRQLQVARETARLSLERVAAELHLSTATVSAIEQDRYEGLPSAVFVIGYLRSYARLLRLDPAPLLEGYRRLQPAAGASATLATPDRPSTPGNPVVMPLLSLALVLCLAGGIWFWWNNQPPTPPAEDTTAEDNHPDASIDQASAPGFIPKPVLPRPPVGDSPSNGRESTRADSATGSNPDQPSKGLETSPAPDETTDPPSDEPEIAPPAPNQPSSGLIAAIRADSDGASAPVISDNPRERASADEPAEIVMTFSGPCWVDVRDSSGDFKLFGEMNKGDNKTLGGRAPYSIILGNATAVRLTIDGKPFDVEAIARGNVARFDLDPARL